VFATLHEPSQDSEKIQFEDILYLVKVGSYNSIFAFTSMCASLTENAGIDEQLVEVRECVYTCRVRRTCHRVGKLLPIESRTPKLSSCTF